MRCGETPTACAHPRSPRVPPGQIVRHLPGGRPTVGDAVGDADAAKSAAGDEDARSPREAAIDCVDPRRVADFVLGGAALPAIDARQQRLAAETDERRQRRKRSRNELFVGAAPARADRGRRRRRSGAAPCRPAPGAATSTTSTSRRESRSSPRAARRIPNRSAACAMSARRNAEHDRRRRRVGNLIAQPRHLGVDVAHERAGHVCRCRQNHGARR